jgi:hypothetical protein
MDRRPSDLAHRVPWVVWWLVGLSLWLCLVSGVIFHGGPFQ